MNKHILKILLFFFTASIFISCRRDLQTVSVKGRYTLELPSNFEKVSDLNKEASLQYQNPVKGLYAIVIDEPKELLAKALEQNSLYDSYSNNLEGYSKL